MRTTPGGPSGPSGAPIPDARRLRPRVYVSLDPELLAALDALALVRRVPRSRMLDRAIELLLGDQPVAPAPQTRSKKDRAASL